MSLQILYQNQKNGEAWDISSLVKSPKWKTKRAGSPASFEFEVLKDKNISWEMGGIVAVKRGSTGLFYGYVFKVSQTHTGFVNVTAYDQTIYLKQNKETYVITGRRADEIAAMIARDFKLKTGLLVNTRYTIPSLVEDGQTLIDIILKALDLTLINTREMFYLWDDYGSLRISNVKTSRLDLLVGDGSLATGYTYATDIESDTYNRIKLVRNNKESGRRDVYIFQDSNNIRLWGTLQHYEQVNESLNPAQIKARGDNLLLTKNRPKRTFDLDALSDLSVRAGRCLFIRIEELGISQFFVVEEANHDLEKEAMRLKLRVI